MFKDSHSSQDAILSAVPVVASGAEFKGVVAGISTLSSLLSNPTYSAVLEITAGGEGFAYLVDGKGLVIYHRDSSQLGRDLSDTTPVMQVSRGEADAVITKDSAGEKVISGFAPVPGTSWGVITQEEWGNVVGPIQDYGKLLVVLLALGGVLSGSLIFFAIGRVLKPIKDLTRGVERVSEGDFDHTIVAKTGDEIEDLAERFNAMAGALKGSYTELERRVEARTEELRLSEEQSRETHRLLSTVVQAAPVAILAHDHKAHISMWSRGAEQIFGWTEDEVIGRDVPPFVAMDKEDEYRSNVRRVLQGESREGFEARRQTKDGALIDVGIWTAPLRDARGDVDGIMTIMVDVTQRKRIEEALSHYTDELARSNADLEQFAYVASHDLQEPLRMVSSYTELLARRYEGRLDSDADEFIAYAVDGATRMQALINDLLAYSRIGSSGEPTEAVECGSVFRRVVGNLRAAINDTGAEVTSDRLPTVRGDESQLALLFQNLIANGIKFGGDRTPQVHLSAERRNGSWLFSVRDNGIGIEREYSERIFGIFQRLHTREEYPGTGVGLAICKRVVERHNGIIWVESEPGTGSVFKFTLPELEEDGR